MSDFKSDAAPRRPTVDIRQDDALIRGSLSLENLKPEADQRRGRL